MKYLLFLFLINTTYLLKAQDTLAAYFNNDERETVKDSAAYYQKVYKSARKKMDCLSLLYDWKFKNEWMLHIKKIR
jgi:hypothetical protein